MKPPLLVFNAEPNEEKTQRKQKICVGGAAASKRAPPTICWR